MQLPAYKAIAGDGQGCLPLHDRKAISPPSDAWCAVDVHLSCAGRQAHKQRAGQADECL